ncbi:MAG: DUF4418 family protein [Geobacteraceae bacterium]|jgi:hypothetical protein
MTRSWKIMSVFALLVSLALLVVPRIFPVCGVTVQTAGGAMAPMRCFYTLQAEYLMALASLLVSGALFCTLGSEARRLLGLFLVLLGAIIVVLAQRWAVGVCAGPEAPCHLTRTLTVAGGVVLVITGGILSRLASSADA